MESIIDWDSISVTISEESIYEIESILSSYSEFEIERMIAQGQAVYEKYFSVNNLHQTILHTLSDPSFSVTEKREIEMTARGYVKPQDSISKCCVVVPFYQTNISDDEWMALKNNRKILNDYSFIAVAPEGLNLTPITDRIDFQEVKQFDPAYFESPQTYNKLLVFPGFWDAFPSFEYMLIAQLDALVFRDNLDEWCRKGYAYIGAPWLNGFGTNNTLSIQNIRKLLQCSIGKAQKLHEHLSKNGIIDVENQLNLNWRKILDDIDRSQQSTISAAEISSYLDKLENIFHKFVGVGNGGLSLRNISKAQAVLKSTAIVTNFALSSSEVKYFSLMKHDLDQLKELASMIIKLNRIILLLLKKKFIWQGDNARRIANLPEYSPQTHASVCMQLSSIRKQITKDSINRNALEIIDKFYSEMISIYLNKMTIPEDFFWGKIANFFSDDYLVAPEKDALQFSFECNPSYCYEKNKRQLPFGCHAWQLPKNRTFWEPIITEAHSRTSS